MSAAKAFSLTKWYLDCVADDGEAFIAYAGTLKWRGLSMHYASLLTHTTSNANETRTSLREQEEPAVSAESIEWHAPAFDLKGRWIGPSDGITRELFSTPKGALCWNCLQPLARVNLCLGKDRVVEGLGYAERMDLSIPPWELKVQEVRWGRFLSGHNALVWIAWWGGDQPSTRVFWNGGEICEGTFTDREITFGHGLGILTFRDTSVLRSGPLVSTALAGIPGISRILPERILRTHECKWLSRGRLIMNDSPPREGWAIHEVVRFA